MANAPFIVAPVRVQGVVELQRAFRTVSKDFSNGIKEVLENAAQPVADAAESLARTQISHMSLRTTSVPWWKMRIGSSFKAGVFMAPEQRGVKRGAPPKRRPGFKDPMLNKAMLPALASNKDKVVRQIGHEFPALFRAWGRI